MYWLFASRNLYKSKFPYKHQCWRYRLSQPVDDDAKPLRIGSTTHLRDLLKRVPPFPGVLVQHCVHDEMCGVREGPIGALRIPFSLASSL
ncbi:DUF6482 family protein [Pseudomonas sp. B22129]|uniref:DUF6482 family protein n=1 Tax=Pseudomonas sp. B22129 TaxID=3235111 RepID=UPI0037834B04